MYNLLFKKDGQILLQVCDTTDRHVTVSQEDGMDRLTISDGAGELTDIWVKEGIGVTFA